jgi:hypothetical protein
LVGPAVGAIAAGVVAGVVATAGVVVASVTTGASGKGTVVPGSTTSSVAGFSAGTNTDERYTAALPRRVTAAGTKVAAYTASIMPIPIRTIKPTIASALIATRFVEEPVSVVIVVVSICCICTTPCIFCQIPALGREWAGLDKAGTLV